VQPIEATWLPSIGVEGTLMPAREADLAFKVPGQLARLDVKAGDWVEAGATLGALDVSEAAAQLRAAEAQVRVARAQVFLAEDDAKRMETLAGSGAATTVMAGDAKGRAEISAGQLDAAQAQLVLSQTNVRNHSLTAPFAGFVTKAPTAAGGIVGPSAPLFHLQDVATLRLVGTVSEQDIGLIKPGATLTFAVPEGDGKSKTIEAKVTTVLPSVDPQTRRVPFEAEVKNEIIGAGKSTKTVSLRGGTFVRGKLAGDAPITVLRLPATVIRPGSQDEVLVVDQGKVHARRISFATAADGAVLVRSGLAKNETVMLTPVAESKEGDVVTPITTPDEGARNLSAGSKGK
jgi:RND family efflux transporter MFP subunit